MQKGTGKALVSEIARGDFWRAFLGSFKRGVVRSKSLQRPPRWPRSVLLTRIKDGILEEAVVVTVAISTSPPILQSADLSNLFNHRYFIYNLIL